MSASVWRKVKLINKADVNRGGSPRPIEAFITERMDGINWIKIGDVEKGVKYIEKTKERIIPEGEIYSRKVVKGDFLLSNSMSFGRPYILQVDGCIHDGWLAIQNYNETFDTEFLYYLLSSDDIQRQYKSLAAGSTVLNLNKDIVSEATVLYPQDISEQKHISDILSTCDAVIANTQKAIDKYKAIKQGMMQDLFTRGLTKDGKLRPSYQDAPHLYKKSELGMIPKEWEVKELGELISHIIGGGTPSRGNENYWNGDIPWVTVKDFSDFNPNGAQEYITKLGLARSSSNLINPGSLIVATRISLGKAYFYNVPIAINQDMKALSFANTDLGFMFYWFQQNGSLISDKGMGSTVKGIQQSDLLKIKLFLPTDITEQTEIAKRLSSIDSTIQKEEAILAKYKNIKTGLMARLLTVPQDAQIIDETGEE